MENTKNLKANGPLQGFSPVSDPRIFWKSRRRSASGRNLDRVTDEPDTANPTSNKQGEFQVTTEKNHLHDSTMATEENNHDSTMVAEGNLQDSIMVNEVSERRKALFEPLEPIYNINGKRPSAESLLPPPDFDSTPYPKGWLIGKKRKLVNVDVVESMRRIAIQEMNRKDREIDALSEQLEEDSRCMEHLQTQFLQERSKRTEVERENTMLQDQVSLLMNMLGQNEDEQTDDEP